MIITLTKKQTKEIISLLSDIKSQLKSEQTVSKLQKVINMFRNGTKLVPTDLLPFNVEDELSVAVDNLLDEARRNGKSSKYCNEIAKDSKKLGL